MHISRELFLSIRRKNLFFLFSQGNSKVTGMQTVYISSVWHEKCGKQEMINRHSSEHRIFICWLYVHSTHIQMYIYRNMQTVFFLTPFSSCISKNIFDFLLFVFVRSFCFRYQEKQKNRYRTFLICNVHIAIALFLDFDFFVEFHIFKEFCRSIIG